MENCAVNVSGSAFCASATFKRTSYFPYSEKREYFQGARSMVTRSPCPSSVSGLQGNTVSSVLISVICSPSLANHTSTGGIGQRSERTMLPSVLLTSVRSGWWPPFTVASTGRRTTAEPLSLLSGPNCSGKSAVSTTREPTYTSAKIRKNCANLNRAFVLEGGMNRV